MKAKYFIQNSNGIITDSANVLTRLRLVAVTILTGLSLIMLPSVTRSEHLKHSIVNYDTALKDFEGFYQLPNKVAYLEITQQGNNLIAKQLWDQREYVLVRKSDLEFESKNEEHQCVFSKDNSGKVVSLKAMNRIIMTKVNFNPQVETVLPHGKLEVLGGQYQFNRDKEMVIELKAKDNSLILTQVWDGKQIVFSALSETDFYNKEMQFPLTFIKQGDVVKQVICFGNDLWDKIQ